jgi:hypothetical protein
MGPRVKLLKLCVFRLHLEKLGHPIVNDYLYNPVDKLARYDIDQAPVL